MSCRELNNMGIWYRMGNVPRTQDSTLTPTANNVQNVNSSSNSAPLPAASMPKYVQPESSVVHPIAADLTDTQLLTDADGQQLHLCHLEQIYGISDVAQSAQILFIHQRKDSHDLFLNGFWRTRELEWRYFTCWLWRAVIQRLTASQQLHNKRKRTTSPAPRLEIHKRQTDNTIENFIVLNERFSM